VSAVASPRRRSRRRPPTAGQQRPASTARRRTHSRSRTFGRAASLPSYLGVGVVALLLGGIVTLQIGALRANMDAGRVDAQRRAVLTTIVNQRAELARQFPRSKVDALAGQLGMVLPSPDAYRQIRIGPAR
jgi:hypothetical protein